VRCCNTDSATAADDDFPTPESLRQANAGYKQKKIAKDENGRVVPSPAVRTKQQIFKLSDYKAIDNKACQVRILKFLTIVRQRGVVIHEHCKWSKCQPISLR